MLNRKNLKKGFTLIELLVVIAIIGILASIVLASLNNARKKGNDAKVKSNLAGARVAAEIYFDNHNQSYVPAAADVDACNAGMFADTQSGMDSYTDTDNYPGGTTIVCNSDASPTRFAISGTLQAGSDSDASWCIDSDGDSKEVTGADSPLPAGDTDC